MAEIKSIAIAGASGHIGPHVIKAFVDRNFEVTVLTRSKKPGAHDDAGVKEVLEVDFTSVESLTTALKGVDGVVSTVGAAAIESQTVLIDAAVAAGVKRFIPSEYGSCTTNPKLETFPMYNAMFKLRKYLQESSLTWTVLVPGAFLEFLIGGPLFVDLVNHKATLFDEGNNRASSTSLPNVGRAIAGIFENFEATKNRIVQTSEVILTQNELIKIAGDLKPDVKWKLSKVQTSALREEALAAVKAGDFSTPVMMNLIKGTAMAGDTYRAAYDTTDNQLLGIKELTREDLKALIAEKSA